jgi:hypothetical protein
MRWPSLVWVCTSRLRWRVRSRSSRMARGDTKLPRSRPCSSSSASHAASATVGFSAGHHLDMLGVDQHKLKSTLCQHIPHRFPVLAGRLHHHMTHRISGQLIRQFLHVASERAKRAHLR